jgi:hypothetical protein
VLNVAPLVMTKFALTVVELTAETPVAVTPVPEIVTAVAPDRLVPVRVTGTVVPCVPLVGLIAVRVGP